MLSSEINDERDLGEKSRGLFQTLSPTFWIVPTSREPRTRFADLHSQTFLVPLNLFLLNIPCSHFYARALLPIVTFSLPARVADLNKFNKAVCLLLFPQCIQGCDYCKDPDAVDELLDHWQRGVTAGHNRSVTAGRTYIAHSLSSGEDDELYGGGKWGYERK